MFDDMFPLLSSPSFRLDLTNHKSRIQDSHFRYRFLARAQSRQGFLDTSGRPLEQEDPTANLSIDFITPSSVVLPTKHLILLKEARYYHELGPSVKLRATARRPSRYTAHASAHEWAFLC